MYQYLLSQRRPGWAVTWLNQAEETRAAYDLELTRSVAPPLPAPPPGPLLLLSGGWRTPGRPRMLPAMVSSV